MVGEHPHAHFLHQSDWVLQLSSHGGFKVFVREAQ